MDRRVRCKNSDHYSGCDCGGAYFASSNPDKESPGYVECGHLKCAESDNRRCLYKANRGLNGL